MRIAQLLSRKGGDVVAIGPDASLSDLLTLLAEHNIGAVVVRDDGGSVVGIVSERDVVRSLSATATASAPSDRSDTVATIMTSEVLTCTPQEDVEALAVRMTENRLRHLPVVDGQELVGIVSIGDVVKSRLDELQAERDQLEDYVRQAP